EPEYQLRRDGSSWKITGPFEAPAIADLARPLTEELGNLRCERYVAHVAKDLVSYGLDKPYLRLAVQEVEKDKPKGDKEKPAHKSGPKVGQLLVGKQTEKDAKTRFAKLGEGEAVFVVGEKLVTAIDHGPLDWLDRNLLSVDSTKIDRLQFKSAAGAITLERQ